MVLEVGSRLRGLNGSNSKPVRLYRFFIHHIPIRRNGSHYQYHQHTAHQRYGKPCAHRVIIRGQFIALFVLDMIGEVHFLPPIAQFPSMQYILSYLIAQNL
jgi:hypothetical protein